MIVLLSLLLIDHDRPDMPTSFSAILQYTQHGRDGRSKVAWWYLHFSAPSGKLCIYINQSLLILTVHFGSISFILDGVELVLVHAFRLLLIIVVIIVTGGVWMRWVRTEGRVLVGWGMELVCFKLVIIGMGVDVDIDEVGEVFEYIGHGCKLVTLLWEEVLHHF